MSLFVIALSAESLKIVFGIIAALGAGKDMVKIQKGRIEPLAAFSTAVSVSLDDCLAHSFTGTLARFSVSV
jgi:hypothetical protein